MKLTVVCLTYNHEKYIRDCLDGFVMQQTNFPFQVLIGDDASTDATPAIIREYAKKYPEILKPILREKNIGVKANVRELYSLAKTPYLAICEGDDYWTDPCKLQKQVDFLESHPDFSICFHPVRVHWEDGKEEDFLFPDEKQRFHKTVLTLEDLLKHNFIQTNSVVYRFRFFSESLDYFPQNIQPADWFMHLLHAQTGKIGFLPDVMGVYRRHSQGMWYNSTFAVEKWLLDYGMELINFWGAAEKRFNHVRRDRMANQLLDVMIVALKRKRHDILESIRSEYPSAYLETLNFIHSLSFLSFLKCVLISKLAYGETRSIYRHRKKKYKELKELRRLSDDTPVP